MTLHDMNPILLGLYSFYMAAVVSIVNIEMKWIVEINLMLQLCITCFLYFNSHLEQLQIINKTERFSYKGGVSYDIEVFKRRAGLDKMCEFLFWTSSCQQSYFMNVTA